MPELPEVERERRRLSPAMVGARFLRVRLNRADLRKPFPEHFARRLRGRTVRTLSRRGKYLLAALDSGETLVMHLGMSGSFRIEPTRSQRVLSPLDKKHDHVIFTMSSGRTITFNDPRRFGLMQLTVGSADAHSGDLTLGPEPLSRAFHARALAARAARRRTPVKSLLLDQRVVAGLGNIYASEALHRAGVSPLRSASTLADAIGQPRPAAVALVNAIKATLREAVAAPLRDRYPSSRFRVYDRSGSKCVTRGCPGTVRRITQAGRSTFYCPVCQR